MLQMFNIYIMIIIFSINFFASADFDFNKCTPTKSDEVDFSRYMDSSFNNLTEARWSFYDSQNTTKFSGILVDSNCIPISDAHIRIWEENNSVNSYNYYSGGETYSNNVGRFSFIVEPSSICSQIMNISVIHPHFKQLETKIKLKNCDSVQTPTMVLVLDGKNKYRKY